MPVQKIEALAQRRQHAEREHVDLEQAERVEIVLVPFDRRALFHRRVHHRRDFVEPVAGDDEAAAVLSEMARKADELLRHLKRKSQRRLGGIKPDPAHAGLPDRRRLLAPGGPVEGGDDIVREAENLGRLADRRAGAVGRHRGGEAGALAPVSLIDVLDHLLAPLMLEVDVDIGGLVALGRDEALEQKIEPRRIDLGDPEAEADGGIGRRAAALTQDAARAREAHDVVHGEKIRRVAERSDQREFMGQRLARPLRNALGIAGASARFREGLERGLGGRMAFAQLFRIAMRQFIEAEGKAVEEAHRLRDRLRRLGEEAGHFARGLEMPLGVGLRQAPRGLERRPFADAGDDVGERAPLGRMHQRVIGRDQRRADLARKRRTPRESPAHVLAISQTRANPQALAEGVAQAGDERALPPPLRGRVGAGGRAALCSLGLAALLPWGPRDPPP